MARSFPALNGFVSIALPELPPGPLYRRCRRMQGERTGYPAEFRLLEKCAEAFVAFQNVLYEPLAEKIEQFKSDGCVLVIQLVLQGLDLGDQILVLLPVHVETGVTGKPHQAFLKHEMRARVFGQPIKDFARSRFAAMLPDGDMQLVDKPDERPVLFIDFFNVDAEIVRPLKHEVFHIAPPSNQYSVILIARVLAIRSSLVEFTQSF